MSDSGFVSRPVAGPLAPGTEGCPRVADLIHFALGKAPPEEKQRVEMHLHQGHCPHCRNWIDKATRLGLEPESSVTQSVIQPPIAFAHPATPQPGSSGSTFGQQEALRDLELRLRRLEEVMERDN